MLRATAPRSPLQYEYVGLRIAQSQVVGWSDLTTVGGIRKGSLEEMTSGLTEKVVFAPSCARPLRRNLVLSTDVACMQLCGKSWTVDQIA
jgi:hypothetical protein